MTVRVLYFAKAGEDFYDLIRQAMPDGFELVTFETGSEEERLRLLADAEAVIVGGPPLKAHYIAAAPKLRVVLHQGVGYHDTVDTDALMKRQVRIALTPEGTSEGVSEHAIMMMLAAGRRLAFVDAELRQGRWHSNTFRANARQLMGATIGIVGLGRIGREVARRIGVFGAKAIYTDLLEMPAALERELNVRRVSLDDLLAESDFVTLHVPLTDKTFHMIDAPQLARMRPGSILVNCARGPVVSEPALVAALESGHLGGAGLDVFEVEPPAHPTPFAAFPNVVMSPHHAPGTRDTMSLKFRQIFANARRFLAGERMENEVSLS